MAPAAHFIWAHVVVLCFICSLLFVKFCKWAHCGLQFQRLKQYDEPTRLARQSDKVLEKPTWAKGRFCLHGWNMLCSQIQWFRYGIPTSKHILTPGVAGVGNLRWIPSHGQWERSLLCRLQGWTPGVARRVKGVFAHGLLTHVNTTGSS